MFNKAQMSPDEWQFIRAYCMTIQKHYDVITIVRALMHPDKLAVKCSITASRLALKMHELQKEQCAKIEALAPSKRKSYAAEKVRDEDIADIFMISFFKLVDGETKKVLVTDKGLPTHDGWSSGHPADWQNTIKALQEIHFATKPGPDVPVSLFLQALLKLFAKMPKNKTDGWEKSEEEEYEEWDEDDEDDDYNDDPMSFFM
jgi:hypothetical protein